MSEELPAIPVGARSTKPNHPTWLPLVIDFGPLLVFFITYKLTKTDAAFGATAGAIKATIAFMIAMLIALAVSQWKLKKISPMLWLSTILVLASGTITVLLEDERYIVMKPTIFYAGIAAMLLVGWAFGKPLLRYLLQAAYDGLDNEGWLKLSRNWGLFFAVLGVANHIMYEMIQAGSLTFDTWLSIKVWGVSVVSFFFALSQLPMMLKHGLNLADD